MRLQVMRLVALKLYQQKKQEKSIFFLLSPVIFSTESVIPFSLQQKNGAETNRTEPVRKKKQQKVGGNDGVEASFTQAQVGTQVIVVETQGTEAGTQLHIGTTMLNKAPRVAGTSTSTGGRLNQACRKLIPEQCITFFWDCRDKFFVITTVYRMILDDGTARRSFLKSLQHSDFILKYCN